MNREDIEKIIKDMRLFLTNLDDIFILDKRMTEILLDYIKGLEDLNNMYGYFLSVISSNTKKFRKYRENKRYRLIDFDYYDKYMEDEENE